MFMANPETTHSEQDVLNPFVKRRCNMFRRFRIKAIVLGTLLAVPLIFALTANSFAGEPPPGAKIVGKSYSAVLTVTRINIENSAIVVQVLAGSCNGIPFAYGPFVNFPIDDWNSIPGITAEQLDGFFLPGAAPPGCYSDVVGDLIITKVNTFNNTGIVVGADVSFQFVQY